MEIQMSKVYRNLETRLKIGSVDVFDLLLILLFSGVMNIFFGGTALGIWMVFVLPGILLLTLYFSKRGRPDKFLERFIRFYFLPPYLKGGKGELNYQKRSQRIWHGQN